MLTVAIFGATGTAGFEALRQCLADDRVGEVRAITRRPTGLSHAKLREVICDDYLNLPNMDAALAGVDACFFCLGISTTQARDEAHYREVTREYAMAAARKLLALSPACTFVYLSGGGAGLDSRWMWARVKAETERDLGTLGLARLFNLRPGYIHPARDRKSAVFMLRVSAWLHPLFRIMGKGMTIKSAELGRAMIALAAGNQPGGTFGNAALRKLAL